jgi:restriction system protein
MARRKNTSEGLFEFIFSFPWWVNVLLAVIAYFGFRFLAGMQFNLPKNLWGISGLAVKQFIQVSTFVFQYLVPLVFLIGAVGAASTGC